MSDNHFEELSTLNVNKHTEKKDGLTYLSWSWAWAEFKKRYPTATYEIKTFSDADCVHKPYMFDEKTGYMVMTSVTVNGLTHEMWLPVMDGKNKAMKSEAYTYSTKYGDKTVEAATMFDVNKTIMRCLVKNLAMFGLGLYIYAGEDLPDEDKKEEKPKKEKPDFEKEATAQKTAETKALNKAYKEGKDYVKPQAKGSLDERYNRAIAWLNTIDDSVWAPTSAQRDGLNTLLDDLKADGEMDKFYDLKQILNRKDKIEDEIKY